MIHVDNLRASYGRFKAIKGVSFDVADGKSLALWGPNGAGKTTIIRCLLGHIRSKGKVSIAGYNIHKHGRASRRMIGYVPQELAFYDDFRVIESFFFFARIKHESRQRVLGLLEQVGLAEHRKKRVRQLSGGLKQRLALGLALLGDPPLMILDEPTSNLDTQARDGFAAMLNDLRASGKTMLFTSHRLEEVQLLADEVLVLEEGKVRASCEPSGLVEAAGLHMAIKVCVPCEQIDKAMETLASHGYAPQRNCTGLLVQVRPDRKARPLGVLERAGVHVEDFEITGVEHDGPGQVGNMQEVTK